MPNGVKRIAVTGGAGQIAYNLLFRIASGELLGPNQKVALHILELPEGLKALEGVRMELQDCASPLLEEIVVGSDPRHVFAGVNYALLVGAKPRGPGMERGDLLAQNSQIFLEQGEALDEVAEAEAKVLVVGNPCNSNCLTALHRAKRLSPKNFFAMTQLDENRAKMQLALKAGRPVSQVTNMTIWGNHSATQVPDVYHAKIEGRPATEVINDPHWLEEEFLTTVQKRGAQIIAARGKSSAASAAHAIIDTVRNLTQPTKPGEWFSLGVYSEGNPYGIDQDLVFSFPCVVEADQQLQIVQGVAWNDFLEKKIRISEKELIEERTLTASRGRG